LRGGKAERVVGCRKMALVMMLGTNVCAAAAGAPAAAAAGDRAGRRLPTIQPESAIRIAGTGRRVSVSGRRRAGGGAVVLAAKSFGGMA